MMDPEIPKNEGFFEQINLIVPKGCVLNPAPNKPVSAGTHHPGADVGEELVAPAVVAVVMGVQQALRGLVDHRAVQVHQLARPDQVVERVDHQAAAATDEPGVGCAQAAVGLVGGDDHGLQQVARLRALRRVVVQRLARLGHVAAEQVFDATGLDQAGGEHDTTFRHAQFTQGAGLVGVAPLLHGFALSLTDSTDAGNCTSGTLDWAQRHLDGRAHAERVGLGRGDAGGAPPSATIRSSPSERSVGIRSEIGRAHV